MKGKRFILVTIVEIVIILLIVLDLFIMPSKKDIPEKRLENWQTEANLPVIGRREYYDAVFLGTSHARIFSRFKNHDRVEAALDKTFINLGQGYERGGVKSQQTYLDYFYQRGNFANTLVYFVDPFIFYRKSLDENHTLYVNEPFREDFFSHLQDEETSQDIVSFYETKQSRGIQPTKYPEFEKNYMADIGKIDEKAIQDRVAHLYTDPYNQQQFDKTLQTLLETIRIARGRGMRVVVILPTTQIPRQPQDEPVITGLRKEAKTGLFEFYDFSRAITDPALYYDTDHLNTPGILYFTKKHLKPILDK